MALNIFGKKKKIEPKTTTPVSVAVAQTEAIATPSASLVPGATVLKNFYVSEKSTHLTGMNQYVFKVAPHATKNEIKKQVSIRYKVKVKEVKVINLPSKRRDIGRHPGVKPGFRKAIVILAPGNTIEQAKA